MMNPTDILEKSKGSPGLYLIATPIGNLKDITFRALEILQNADLIACEDTRVTKKLLNHYKITTPCLSYHEHNAAKMRPKLLEKIEKGQILALVSDAGTPLISDPGYKLVTACIEKKLFFTTIPGPTASIAALTLSGLPPDRFLFAGFPPPKSSARQRFFKEFEALQATLLFYESGPRLLSSLKDMTEVFGDRPAAVVREVTKSFEESRRALLSDLILFYETEGPPRGEIVIAIGPAPEKTFDLQAIKDMLKTALKTQTLRDSVDSVTERTALPRKEIYALALKITKEDGV